MSTFPRTQLRSWEPPLALLGHELVGKLLTRLSDEGEAAWVAALAAELAAGAGLLRSSPAALSTLAGCLALPALPEAEAADLVQVHRFSRLSDSLRAHACTDQSQAALASCLA